MKYIFSSFLADDIHSYITLRCSLGNEVDTFARRLYSFDQYCFQKYPQEHQITQEMCETWCSLRENESLSTLRLRAGIIRDFARYLNSIGKEAFVLPGGYIGKNEKYVPYIYTDEEAAAFFVAADTIGPHKLSPHREYLIPVLFRMMYCCGLRPQEIPALETQNVDLITGDILIVDSKRNKDRIVKMSEDLIHLCQRYHQYMELMVPGRKYFFPGINGERCTVQWIQAQFHKCWKKAGITFSKHHHPRVYDFRHNFATRVICKWMDDGCNIINMLPYLSSYMGHDSIDYTAYYIHLVPGHLTETGLTEWETGIEVLSYED